MNGLRNKAEIRSRLLRRRSELVERRNERREGWERLQEAEVEPEETAQKASLGEGADLVDRIAKEEVEAVDRALGRLESGGYGICSSCGASIPGEEMEATPWRELCGPCEARLEEAVSRQLAARGAPEPSTGPPPLPERFQGMTEDEVAEAVRDALQRDGRVELEDLGISFRDGAVVLEGALPSPRKHGILLDVVQNTLGLKGVADRVRIDRLAWEREGGTQTGIPVVERGETHVSYEEADPDPEAAFESMKSGKPVPPPDELVPEEET